MARLAPGWYVLLYHEVSWEESPCLRLMGAVHAPDVFRSHVEELVKRARVVSVAEGLRRLREGSLREPLFSFWFDDGFSGVRAHALPVLRAHRLTAATSVCSDFASRRDLFWRCKLSYLLFGPDRTRVAPALRQWMGAGAEPVSHITLNRFSAEIVEGLDALYERWTSPGIRERHLRLFDDVSGIRALRDEGWEIANHSASHYPVGEPGADFLLEEQFGRCERFLREAVGGPSFCRVLPFDRPGRRSAALAGRPLALVEPRANRRPDGPLYRIPAPFCSGRELIPWLRRWVWAE